MGIEPTLSAWKAEVLPLNYTRKFPMLTKAVGGAGFEPTKAEPADLQSAPFSHSGTPPQKRLIEKSFLLCIKRPHNVKLKIESTAILALVKKFA